MNNDISRDITSMTSKPQIPTGKTESLKTSGIVPPIRTAEDAPHALDLNFLGALGCAQVNMHSKAGFVNPSVRKSVEEYMKDPFAAEAKIELEDNLMQNQGYDVWKAMKISDKLFSGLGNSDTYKE